MSDERAKRVEEVFLAVADLPRERWAREIAERCDGDAALADEVRSLLDCHAQADSFLDARQLHGADFREGPLGEGSDDDLRPGVRLGEFQIERLLGRGGMGSVFVAIQDKPRRSVALKVIHRGLATPGLLRRFEHEAEVLGRLHHPGIAQIFEAGVGTTGAGDNPRPYIAMELINGPTLGAYAEAHRLDVRARLELVARVCDAVHHAHQHGVIHRDLKPANILVDENGQPKVLDFGVARAADADLRVTTMQTSVGQLIGTLPYMSPEQVLADPDEVDNRSDIYALGVILYQILAGRLPLDLSSRSIPEAARVIREDRPTKLSSVSRVFRGEIDIIVSKAMDKDKQRRYQTAADLADDIRRHLAGEPIRARQDSALYILRTQLRRHRWAVAAALFFLTGLLAFALYAGWSARTERLLAKAANLARQEAEKAKGVSEVLNSRLTGELAQATIERGRLEGSLGNLALAEDVLWREYLGDLNSAPARWGLWELYNRFPILWTVQGVENPTCAAVAQDASVIAMGTTSGMVVLRDGATGRPAGSLEKFRSRPTAIAITPDARTVFVGLRDGRGFLANLEDGGQARALADGPIHSGLVRTAIISRDGTLLATGGDDGKITVWDLRTAKALGGWTAHSDPVSALAFNAAGNLLASSGGTASKEVGANIWHVPDGTPEWKVTGEHLATGTSLRFSEDGSSLLMVNSDRSAAWYDLRSGNATELEGSFVGAGVAVAPSPDGSRLFVGGAESIYQIGSTRPSRALGRQRYDVLSAAWKDSNTIVMVTREGVIRAIDIRDDLKLRRIEGFRSWCFDAAYSPDGTRLAIGAGDGTVVVVDPGTLERRAVARMPIETFRTRALLFLSDSTTLLAGGADGAVRVIDARDGSISGILKSSSTEIFRLAVGPGEQLMAAAHGDGVVRIWDLRTRALTHQLAKLEHRVEGLAFSPDGSLLISAGAPGAATWWDTGSWEPVTRVETTGEPWGVAFSPDGGTVLVSTHDGAVDVFDTRTRSKRAVLLAHERLVPALAYSHNGRYFATGGENGAVKLWDAATLRTLLTLEPCRNEIVSVAFDPSDRYLAATTAARFTAVYDLHALDACITGNADFQRGRVGASRPRRRKPRVARG